MDSQFFIPKEFEELLKEYSLSTLPSIDGVGKGTSTDGHGNRPCSGDLRGIQTNSFNFSKEQEQAYQLLLEGKNVLLTGAAGCGKSHVIKVFIDYIKTRTTKTIYYTATTGIAAYNIGGITINSLLGIGTGEASVDTLIIRIKKQKSLIGKLRLMDVLVIDEMSMMSAELFEKIHQILCYFRKNKSLFGGVQVLLSGDWFQLNPVFKQSTLQGTFTDGDGSLRGTSTEANSKKLLFESELFQKSFTSICLQKNWRQSEDPRYSKMLARIRLGQHTDADVELLRSRIVSRDTFSFPKDSIRLVSSNRKANEINTKELQKLNTKKVDFHAEFPKNEGPDPAFEKLLLQELHDQFSQRGIIKLTLSIDTRVMLIKNLDVEKGLVNGAIGTVIGFDKLGYPIVQFKSGIQTSVAPITWELELGNSKVSGVQIPLMLAWAVTIHKSMSLTLDSAVMDLGTCFTDGMVYVALSRVRQLKDVYLESFDPVKITVNQKAVNYTKCLI
jgi:ATP-dependent DNA helicase PIF1